MQTEQGWKKWPPDMETRQSGKQVRGGAPACSSLWG